MGVLQRTDKIAIIIECRFPLRTRDSFPLVEHERIWSLLRMLLWEV